MSRKNILQTTHLPNGKSRVTFDAADGERTYEYIGNSAKALRRGTDPSNLAGRLIKHEKKEKQ